MKYHHYIALDWAKSNMAIARMTEASDKVTLFEGRSDVRELKTYLAHLKGSKILGIEETTTTQWLYTELVDSVDEIFVCDPYRNRLLSEGPKTDKIDAAKLVQLLRAGLMKEVYHTGDELVMLRKLVSGYEDLVKAGVRLKNQRAALLRGCGKESKKGIGLEHPSEDFVLKQLEDGIELYKRSKEKYKEEFQKWARRYPVIRHQASLPGISLINAVKIVARVVSPHRFKNRGHYWSYCGLIKLEKISGQKSYGRKNSRFCRQLKCVYKTAALAAIQSEGLMQKYYHYLIQEKRFSEQKASHALARRIAALSYGVFKKGKRYEEAVTTKEI